MVGQSDVDDLDIRRSILSVCRDAPNGAVTLNFGIQGDIDNMITHAKFCDILFRDFGVLIPLILPFSIGIAVHPYNSIRIGVHS